MTKDAFAERVRFSKEESGPHDCLLAAINFHVSMRIPSTTFATEEQRREHLVMALAQHIAKAVEFCHTSSKQEPASTKAGNLG